MTAVPSGAGPGDGHPVPAPGTSAPPASAGSQPARPYPRGAAYDARFEHLAATGVSVHGEVDLVTALLADLPDPAGKGGPPFVLDAGCGTGRVAIELARRGVRVAGIDVDPVMVDRAREKAPTLDWAVGDLAEPATFARFRPPDGTPVDLAVLAGNVMIFVRPGTEARVLANLAGAVRVGGLVVAGFQLRDGSPGPDDHDRWCDAAGLRPLHRYATWDREPFPGPAADYLVAVHRRT